MVVFIGLDHQFAVKIQMLDFQLQGIEKGCQDVGSLIYGPEKGDYRIFAFLVTEAAGA